MPSYRLDEVVDEPGENARRFGGVEAGDLVAPAFTTNLVKRRLEPAGDQLFVEAWRACWWQRGSSVRL